ncbi:MAG: hypothetical protein JWM44_4334 [Bacilli bacterium]|nr:hypothetical protein [Bacilli bacterium]
MIYDVYKHIGKIYISKKLQQLIISFVYSGEFGKRWFTHEKNFTRSSLCISEGMKGNSNEFKSCINAGCHTPRVDWMFWK